MRLVFLCFAISLLAACGGEDSTANTEPGTVTPVEPQPEPITDPDPDPEPTPDPDPDPDPEPEPDPEPTPLDNELQALIQRFALPSYPLPKDNAPQTEGALFELGKELFFSKALSMDLDVACASCHHPLLGGGDALSQPVGVDALDPDLLGPGRTHDGNRLLDELADGAPNVPRNSPTTFNLQFYDRSMFWD